MRGTACVPGGGAGIRSPTEITGKIQYLEGLRGVAAIQVVLLHFVTAFLPDTAEHAAAPLRVLFDGHTAVYVFFLISGAVLTPSFARGGPLPALALKRAVRLGIPVIAAAACALALLAAMPNAHGQAAAISGSAWLVMDSSGATTLLHFFHEIAFDSMLIGYREYTLFVPFADRLPLLQDSLDAPFWSLHLELYGSFLVLLLTTLRARSVGWRRIAVVLCAVLFGTHPMFLFVIGHLAGAWLQRAPRMFPGIALIALGIAMSASKDWHVVDIFHMATGHVMLVESPNLFQFQSQIAALALFFGVLLSPAAHRALSSAPCRALGRLSFSIYLLHFPILFTATCVGFMALTNVCPYPLAVAVTFGGFMAATLLASVVFERFIDRAAIRVGRRVAWWPARRTQRDMTG